MASDFRNLIVSVLARRRHCRGHARASNQEKQVVVNLEVSSAPVKLRSGAFTQPPKRGPMTMRRMAHRWFRF